MHEYRLYPPTPEEFKERFMVDGKFSDSDEIAYNVIVKYWKDKKIKEVKSKVDTSKKEDWLNKKY